MNHSQENHLTAGRADPVAVKSHYARCGPGRSGGGERNPTATSGCRASSGSVPRAADRAIRRPCGRRVCFESAHDSAAARAGRSGGEPIYQWQQRTIRRGAFARSGILHN